jgi:hypothetical protein
MGHDAKTPNDTPASDDPLAAIFLKEKQLAARHRLAPNTLRNYRVDGKYIEFVDLEPGIRYNFAVVVAFERSCRVPCRDEEKGLSSAPIVDPLTETFLTPPELASRHQLSVSTLSNKRKRYIPYYKIEGSVLYALSDILAYEASHRATSTTMAQARREKRLPSSRPNVLPDIPPNDF